MTEKQERRKLLKKIEDIIEDCQPLETATSDFLAVDSARAAKRILAMLKRDKRAKLREVIDYQMNKTDLWWLRWIFDALDGRNTSSDPK